MTSQIEQRHASLVRLFGILVMSVGACSSHAQNTNHSVETNSGLTYPKTRQVDHIDEYHGIRLNDPFRWLEDMESVETQEWAKAQDELTKSILSAVPARAAIHKRIAELWNFDLYTIPSKAGRHYFYTKTNAGKSQPGLYVQDTINGEPRLLLDPLARLGDRDLRFAGFWPSPDGLHVACAFATGQSRWWRLRVLEASKGREVETELVGLHGLGGGISWTQDGKGFFYSRFEVPKEGDELETIVEQPKIYYHRMGTNQSEDQLVYARPDKPKWLFTTQTTNAGDYLIISAREGSHTENAVYYRALHSRPAQITPLLEKADGAYTILGNNGSRFWFYTDRDAPRGRIVAIDITKPQPEHWVEVIPQAEETIAGGSLAGGNALGLFGHRFVIMYMKDGCPLVKVFDIQGRYQYSVDLPPGGSIWGGFSGTQDDHEVFYQFLGLTDPSSIHRLDLETGKTTIFRRSQVGFNPDEFVTKQVFFQSQDGTNIPMFISHKKGMQLDGSNPAFIYGYGAFGWSSFLWYQPHLMVWMETGGVYAQPSIRGGGEYGEAWHQAGMKLNKQNAVDDYLASAGWLITNKYTSPSRLAANGGSASGALAGAAIIQRPDLFGASIIDRPALDMIRFDKFTGATHWIQEFGSSANADEFKALLAFSPYHNVKPGECYPPTLIMVGDRDEVTVPMHAYKFTAALQAAQGCEQPVLLKMMWGAGHNFGVTPEQVIDARTDEIAFLARVLNLGLRRCLRTQTRHSRDQNHPRHETAFPEWAPSLNVLRP
jgi:prolyl oligopeptidase